MKITITYEEADLLKFIEQMLAVKGLKPRAAIRISTDDTSTGDQQPVFPHAHLIVVDCENGPLLDTCPLCNGRLSDGVAVPAPTPKQPAAVPVPMSPPYTQEEIEEADAQIRAEMEKQAEDTLPLDESLGESLEPPVLDEPPPSKGDAGGIRSIVGASERLRAQREKELPRSRQRMRGESDRPPKGGR